jgi:hypothetical protein
MLGVKLGHLDVGVAKNLGQFVQITAVHHVRARERVPEIVESKILDTGKLQDGFETLVRPQSITPGTRLGRKTPNVEGRRESLNQPARVASALRAAYERIETIRF